MGSTPSSVHIELVGTLTTDVLDAALLPANDAIAQSAESLSLLVDATHMEGYDAEARNRFVAWHREHGKRITATAIVTERRSWHMVILAMALASRTKMRPFTSRAEAAQWLRELERPA